MNNLLEAHLCPTIWKCIAALQKDELASRNIIAQYNLGEEEIIIKLASSKFTQSFFSYHKTGSVPIFLDSKVVFTHCYPPPSSSPALTDTTTVTMSACTLALTQPTVKFPWPRPLTGYAYNPCGFDIVVINVCKPDINR